MPEKQIILTAEGLKRIELKLDYLKSTRRREVAERINKQLNLAISARIQNTKMPKMSKRSLKARY